MNRLHHLPVRLAAGLLLAMALASCSLFVSNTRQAKRYLSIFGTHLADKKYNDAAAMMTKDFTYYNLQGQKYKGGKLSAQAFFANIDKLKHTQFYVTIEETKETSETTVWVKVRMQARIADAVSTQNYFWDASMIWVKDGSRWYLKEVKDLSEQTHSRS